MGWKRKAYRVLLRKPEGKRPHGRHRGRWENDIKVGFQEIGCEGVDWTDLAQDKDKWLAIVNQKTQIRSSINPYPTAFPYGNGMVLHFYQQQESSTTKTVHKVINKGLKAYV